MRVPVRRLTLAALTAAVIGVVPAPAGAVGVAYVDGNEVWASSLDGSQKVRLSNGEGDWREVGQNDQGFVVATRRESGKIASLATFTIWKPDGTIKDFGPMAGLTNGGSNAYPLQLELTPDAGLILYGSSNLVLHFPGSTLTQGTFLLPSDTRVAPVGSPYAINRVRFPSLIGDRVIGSLDDETVVVQEPGATGSKNFATWPGIEAAGGMYTAGLDVAANGRYVAIAQYASGGGNSITRTVIWPAPGLGQAPVPIPGAPIPGDAGDCWLVNGEASNPSFSPDGASLAWADPRGVVVAGVPVVQPTTPPDNTCVLSRPAKVISPTGDYPAIGGIDVAAILAARNPVTPGGGTPGGGTGGGTTTPGQTGVGGSGSTPSAVTFTKLTSLKLSSLGAKSGASVEVTPTVSGKASFTLTVDPKALGKKGTKPVTIATGKGTLTSGKKSKVKLRANSAGKKAAKKLKKKKATLTVTIGEAVTTTTVTLK